MKRQIAAGSKTLVKTRDHLLESLEGYMGQTGIGIDAVQNATLQDREAANRVERPGHPVQGRVGVEKVESGIR